MDILIVHHPVLESHFPIISTDDDGSLASTLCILRLVDVLLVLGQVLSSRHEQRVVISVHHPAELRLTWAKVDP